MRNTYTRTREHGTQETVAATPAARIAAIRQVVIDKQYAKVDGAMMDLFTASLIISVYDQLGEGSKQQYASMQARRMGIIGFKLQERLGQ